jgi:chaperone required for assembly of F1-ATPase
MNTSNNNALETRVNNALASLDGLTRATPNPYLYTRVKARLEEHKSPWSKAARFLSQPAWAFSAAILFVSLNVWVAISNNIEMQNAAKTTAIDKAFDTEYAVVNYSLEANK